MQFHGGKRIGDPSFVLRFPLWLTAAILCWSWVFPALTQPGSFRLFEDFETGWEQRWREKKFPFKSPNHIEVVWEENNPALKIMSKKSASGMWRKWEIEPAKSGFISWRWKVENSLTENSREREKKGDDYAARVFVVFEPHFLSWKTRTICYVWAGNEPGGSVYRSPYSGSVGTFVLRSGNDDAGQWVTEKRDFAADYREFFGEAPRKISAVALMVDTDNTGAQTTAWFDDLIVELSN